MIRVESGDTLTRIAHRHGTTVEELIEANPQLQNPDKLQIGQSLNVPEGTLKTRQVAPPPPKPKAPKAPQEQNQAPEQPAQAPRVAPKPTGEWQLPDKGTALKLVASDFATAARDLKVEVAAIQAVAEVEAGGRSGFDAQKRPKILFEVHKFRKHTASKYDKSHPHLSAPYKSKIRRQSYKKDQWKVLHEAFALNPEAAVKSASWGMFQVMGENYEMCGWVNVRQFVTDMFASEGQHMRAFLGFARASKLVRHIKSKSWAAFAKGYNGPDYASNAYDTKMANAYKRHCNGGGKLATKK